MTRDPDQLDPTNPTDRGVLRAIAHSATDPEVRRRATARLVPPAEPTPAARRGAERAANYEREGAIRWLPAAQDNVNVNGGGDAA